MALEEEKFSFQDALPKRPRKKKSDRHFFVWLIVFSLIFGLASSALVGGFVYWKVNKDIKAIRASVPILQEERTIDVVKEVSPAVVSIILTKDVPIFEQVFRDPFEDFFGESSPFSPFLIPEVEQKGTEKREIGGGSGFFVSADGLVVTNKHVVLQDDVEYTVFTREGKSYEAEVLARDPVQDLAVLRIEKETEDEMFPFVKLGNSHALQIGQTVIAIGNALGEFRNTVSTGVISGLGRTITASDGAEFAETIENVIQTDAAINRGNSGGPLLNLTGEVIGMNTATVLDAQNIGFAIPVHIVKRDVEQVKEGGEIVYPFLGVQYILVTPQIQEDRDLPVDYGALISSDDETSSIVSGSAAEKAGLQDGDIIIKVQGKRITKDNSLAKELQKYKPTDTVQLTILREGEELELQAILSKRES